MNSEAVDRRPVVQRIESERKCGKGISESVIVDWAWYYKLRPHRHEGVIVVDTSEDGCGLYAGAAVVSFDDTSFYVNKSQASLSFSDSGERVPATNA